MAAQLNFFSAIIGSVIIVPVAVVKVHQHAFFRKTASPTISSNSQPCPITMEVGLINPKLILAMYAFGI